MTRSADHELTVIECLKDDPETALLLLDEVLADGDQEELLLTLRRMSEAFGGPSHLAKDAGISVAQAYRTLSDKGNPTLTQFSALLNAMGLRLSIKPAGQNAH